jgi:cold shock CspA family protein
MSKQKAVICAYLETKGFGFLSSGTGKDFKKWFFHIKQYKSEGLPVVGATVTFDESPIPEGPSPTALGVELVASSKPEVQS